jgi:hypothetical protein
LCYFTPNNLNGNIKIELINLKIISIENPMILKGNNSNQIIGKAKSKNNASGQHKANRTNQSKMASNVFIDFLNLFSKPLANYKTSSNAVLERIGVSTFFIIEQ